MKDLLSLYIFGKSFIPSEISKQSPFDHPPEIAAGNFSVETEADALQSRQTGSKTWYKDTSRGYMHDGTPVGGTQHTNLGEGAEKIGYAPCSGRENTVIENY